MVTFEFQAVVLTSGQCLRVADLVRDTKNLLPG